MKRTPTLTLLAALVAATFSSAHAQGVRAPARRVPAVSAPRLTQNPNAAARIEVLVLEGTAGPGGIAAGITHLPQLRQPPFNAWSQISLVARHTLALGAEGATASLPNGGSARITSAGRGADGRYPVTVQFTQNGQTSRIDFVSAPGEPFFTVRSRNPQRALIVGFIVRQ